MKSKSPLFFLIYLCVLPIFTNARSFPHYEYKIYSMQNMEEGVWLDGEWDFYWNTTYHHFKQADSIQPTKTHVPGSWIETGFPDKGYGLYSYAIVVHKGAGKELALYIPSVYCNYRLYINDSCCAQVGTFDTTGFTSEPDYHPKIIPFKALSDTVRVNIEVSNFSYRLGGLTYTLNIGTYEKTSSDFTRKIVIQTFFSGSFFIISIYFLFIFFSRRKDNVSLYFALLCFACSVRILFTDLILIRQLNIPLTWEWILKTEYLSIFFIPCFGTLYLVTLLQFTRYRKVLASFIILTVLMSIYVITTNTYKASFVLPLFRYFAAIQLFFQLFIVLQVVWTKRTTLSIVVLIGFVLVFLAGLNDLLYGSGKIDTLYLLPIAIFSYGLLQALILVKGWTFTFSEVERLSVELSKTNKNQELIIQERTQELSLKTEKLEQYNDIKDRIFSIIGHDLRAPIATLSSVLSLAEQADSEKELEELRMYFKGIKISVDNLNLTIENLLVWSQSQINGVKLNVSNVNVNREIENVIALYSLVAMRKDITLKHTLDKGFLAKVDPAHLNLVLRNIISNSLKFTNMGGSITVSASMPNSFVMQISIQDNGIGLQSEKIEEILKPSGAHYTTYGTQNEKGTGLGLMLCKEYIEANGGEINIESTLDIGTIVTIKLPSA
jgi:signal transduction histidine kinase